MTTEPVLSRRGSFWRNCVVASRNCSPEVTAAVNAAPAGQIINHSEEKVLRPARCSRSDRPPLRLPSNSAPTPQAAFPPPCRTPQTGSPLQNKGPDDHTILTVNGRISISRRRYAAPGAGSSYPLDCWLDRAEDSISLGLREMACRLNLASRNFDKAAENLGRAAQVYLSGEFLRQVVGSQKVRPSRLPPRPDSCPIDWTASDCPALDSNEQPTERSRIYLGSDGVMVPYITQKEKQTRRD